MPDELEMRRYSAREFDDASRWNTCWARLTWATSCRFASCGGPAGMAMSPCSRAKSPKAWPAPWSAAVRQRSGVELELHAVVWLPNLPTAVSSLPNAAVVSLSATARLTVLLLALLATTTTIAM